MFENEYEFNLNRFMDQSERNFFAEFGWPDPGEGEDYTGEEGEGD